MSEKSIVWRDATPDDVGRLARFRNSLDENWLYGMIDDADWMEGVFAMIVRQHDIPDNYTQYFVMCEVQEVIE